MKGLNVGAIAGTSATILLTLNVLPVQANGIVPAADGTGTQVTPNGTDHSITGGTTSADNQNLFHRFTEFNLLTGESATFITDPAILNVLSGVTGGNPSIINGLLQVSGSSANLFLINPNGILFGPDAALNLQGSFTAATADQVNFATGAFGSVGSSDYAALVGDPQSFSFSLDNPGSVVNLGSLNVLPGESVVLLGGQVLNLGTIAAPGGEIVISAVAGGNLVRIVQEGSLLNLEVETLGANVTEPTAFSPLTLPALLTGSAIAPADTVVVNPDGSVQLASGALVSPEAGATTVSGAIEVSGAPGGQILVLGNDIALTDTLLDASGTGGGGLVRIGGDYQGQGSLPPAQTLHMDADSTILADARDQGDGGRVILWADGDTRFQGFISAQGGPNGGDGGFIETSGRQSIVVDGGMAIAAAPAGTAGTWLLDPSNITIDEGLALTIQNALAAGTNFVASTIEGATADANGVLPGDGDIFLDSNINATATNNATLTLTASRYIQLSPDFTGFAPINISGGNLVLNLNQEGLAEVTNPTITNALNTVGAVTGGVTINLGAGTYQEGSTLSLFPGFNLQGVGANSTILSGANEYPVVSVSSGSDGTTPPNRISGLTIANGNTTPPASELGSGILNFGNLIIDNSVIRDNQATRSGGGIANVRLPTSTGANEGVLVINNSIISGNRAGADGGGISNNGGTVTINNSTIFGNAADDDGGGVNNGNDGGTVTINNSTIFDNFAIETGGGVSNESIMTIANSTLVGNTTSAGRGGGVLNDIEASQLTIISSLISGNQAASGSGNNVFNVNAGTISTSNSLFGQSGNAGILGFTPAASDIVPSVPITQIVSTSLGNNGGSTPTLALLAGSPAIDAGSGSGLDQRGLAVSGIARDIGAFEFQDGSGGSSSGSGNSSDDSSSGDSSSGSSADAVGECVAGDCNPQTPPASQTEASGSATAGESVEVAFVQQFEAHLGVEAAAFEDIDALDRARAITGVTPALVYARFVPPAAAPAVATLDDETDAPATVATKELTVGDELGQQIVAQAEGQQPTGAIANEAVLQLVLVTADNQPRRINTGATRSEVLAAVQQLQVELTDRTRRRLDNYLIPAQALYGWLMAPLEETLAAEDIGHVSFVLDAGLRSLPIAALHDGDQFIIENYSVGLMPSLSLTDTRIGNIRNAEVLAMGASEFSDQPPLPAVPLEIATINDLWAGTVHLNETFTPSILVAERSENAYPILHLATHGQFTSGALSNSYIQFWDRRIGLDELPQLQLSDPTVELLVLSACRTVLGDGEAELGFAGLAIKSGAKSAIAALWQVSDLETAGLMAELYTHLGQVTYKAEALRQAQLAMLRGEVTIQNDTLIWSGGREPLPAAFAGRDFADTQHPYYWSAFTLVGNPW